MTVDWPSQFKPQACPVHVQTKLQIPLPPEKVWEWLIRADRWPSFYPGCRWVRFKKGGPSLSLGSHFQWSTTPGVSLSSAVVEFHAPNRLAWQTSGLGIDAYEAWVLESNLRGCQLTIEETRKGLAAKLLRGMLCSRIEQVQKDFSHALAQVCTVGSPEGLGARG